MGRKNSGSPVTRVTSHRRSPSRRERSPGRNRNSNTENRSSRNLSPKHVPSRSPEFHSPSREKPPSRNRSPRYRRSPSTGSHFSLGKKKLGRGRSPESIHARSPSPVKDKSTSRTRSPNHLSSRSASSRVIVRSRSPSPRSKRLKRAAAERDDEIKNGKEYENNLGRKQGRSRHGDKDISSDVPSERNERRTERDATGNGSRTRHRHPASPSDNDRGGQRRSRSPPYGSDKRGRDKPAVLRGEDQRTRADDDDSLAKMKAAENELEAKEKQKPSFELSGKLAAETNRYRGITLLFNEPSDSRKPDIRWRLYVFKGGEVLQEPLYVHRQSCYLFGRERRIADVPTDHPSCSKQHAVLQYRQVEVENPDGMMSKKVKPYLMDLGSTNGTFINDNKIEAQRYYELFEKDTIKFGNSSREYVLLHENSAG